MSKTYSNENIKIVWTQPLANIISDVKVPDNSVKSQSNSLSPRNNKIDIVGALEAGENLDNIKKLEIPAFKNKNLNSEVRVTKTPDKPTLFDKIFYNKFIHFTKKFFSWKKIFSPFYRVKKFFFAKKIFVAKKFFFENLWSYCRIFH